MARALIVTSRLCCDGSPKSC